MSQAGSAATNVVDSTQNVQKSDASNNSTSTSANNTNAKLKDIENYPQRQGTFGRLVDPKLCENSCSGKGECHVVFTKLSESSNMFDNYTKYM